MKLKILEDIPSDYDCGTKMRSGKNRIGWKTGVTPKDYQGYICRELGKTCNKNKKRESCLKRWEELSMLLTYRERIKSCMMQLSESSFVKVEDFQTPASKTMSRIKAAAQVLYCGATAAIGGGLSIAKLMDTSETSDSRAFWSGMSKNGN